MRDRKKLGAKKKKLDQPSSAPAGFGGLGPCGSLLILWVFFHFTVCSLLFHPKASLGLDFSDLPEEKCASHPLVHQEQPGPGITKGSCHFSSTEVERLLSAAIHNYPGQ